MEKFPIIANSEEQKYIDEFKDTLNKNIEKTKRNFSDIKRKIGQPTGLTKPNKIKLDLLGTVGTTKKTLDFLKEHHFQAVLTLSLKCGWNPSVILALWVNEGLPAWYQIEHKEFNVNKVLKYRFVPKDYEQARVWALSILLYEIWGLDVLIPHKKIPGKDNVAIYSDYKIHKRVFNTNIERYGGKYLGGNPFEYLMKVGGALKVWKNGGAYHFKFNLEAQSTLLMIQQAIFLNHLEKFPVNFEGFELPIITRPVASCFLYLYHNSGEKNGEKHYKNYIVKRTVKSYSSSSISEINGNHIYQSFTSNRIPNTILDYIDKQFKADKSDGKKPRLNYHGYVNALRFEWLVQLYNSVFKDFNYLTKGRKVSEFEFA